MATLLQSQERLIKIPCAAFLKLLSVHFLWHFLSYMPKYIFFHRVWVHSVPWMSNDHWQRNYFMFSALLSRHSTFTASHQGREHLFTPHFGLFSSASDLFPYPFLAPTFNLPVLVSIFPVSLRLTWSLTPVLSFQVEWHCSGLQPLLR